MLQENVAKIKESCREACKSANRSFDSVTLVAVTKTVSSETTKEIVSLGMTHLAENRVDKLLEKQHDLKEFPGISWHFIGNLQRRKVKSVINHIDYFHALDSLKLAAEIEKRAENQIQCFVEVNVSGEESKQGIPLTEVEEFILQLQEYPKIKVVGLMTMAPLHATQEEIKMYFRLLREKQKVIALRNIQNAPCSELSMGMSQDYPLAIQEGATFIRVGTAFFQSVNREVTK